MAAPRCKSCPCPLLVFGTRQLLFLALVLRRARAAGQEPARSWCESDLNCSLNGACLEGVCLCDRPWSGVACETMDFLPVSFPQGYGMTPNVTSWGGNAIFDGTDYHIFVSTMTNGCPLQECGANSRIDHGTAKTITGPYVFSDVAVNVLAHNSAPIQLPDGSYAIVHIFPGADGPDSGKNCSQPDYERTQQNPRELINEWTDKYDIGRGGSCVHWSKSLYGPWEPILPLDHKICKNCNNPAPWVHPNGTIFMFCQGEIIKASSLTGEWTSVVNVSLPPGPDGAYEDPFLYTTSRGFHLLFHVYNTEENPPHGHECFNATTSAHAYSEDGFTWYTSPVQPYGTQIELVGGRTITVSTRERPKLFFDSTGTMTHLFTAVCGASSCPDGPPTGCVDCKYANWDYTLVSPLDVWLEVEV
eukprot:TRINITY_DN78467_c0_g1_i1.p1 TRINITY_DN78467_c0_g1~~TRINITY_DN78467_c0_g1_i1.p1  ORF type:complete len:416 (-),score=27.68 TRINITY_DN78467_c0_g1_i1:609-1856(-)